MTKQPTPAQLELLAQRRIAAVATVGADGAPHLTATWFLYEDGALYLAIPSGSAKGRNLARNGRVAVMIDVCGMNGDVVSSRGCADGGSGGLRPLRWPRPVKNDVAVREPTPARHHTFLAAM